MRVVVCITAFALGVRAAGGQESEDRQRVPHVVSTVPADGAEGVDPNLDAIRVVFDMPMNSGGYSFTGGGPHFPQPTGTARWIDAYTCELPVRLKPNWDYRFGINGPQFKNFRSVWLEPAEPVTRHFKTGGVAGIHRSPKERRKSNLESFDALCDAMRRRYSYRELRGLDWETLFAEHRRDVVGAADVETWTRRAAAMLKAAGDVHLRLELDGVAYPTAVRNVRPNWSRDGLTALIPHLRQRSPNVLTATTDDGIGYVAIATWSTSATAEIQKVHDYLDEMASTRGLIIDVRPNSGGDESLAREIAAWFVKDRKVYAKHAFRRGPGPADFTPVRERVITPNAPPRRYAGPVAVLTGRANMSSCEAFLLMMKQADGATLIGERSYGSSGNPKPTFLPNGVVAYIPSWEAMTPDGTVFERKGIAPDIVVSSEGVDFSREDPVLATALRVLRASTADGASR